MGVAPVFSDIGSRGQSRLVRGRVGLVATLVEKPADGFDGYQCLGARDYRADVFAGGEECDRGGAGFF